MKVGSCSLSLLVNRCYVSHVGINTEIDVIMLYPDELAGFEEAWNGNVKVHLPGWRDEFDNRGNAGKFYLVLYRFLYHDII